MIHMRLQMQREDVHDTMVLIGHTGVVQFNDMNKSVPLLQRAYTPHVKRCSDLEHRLDYFRAQIETLNIPLDPHNPPSAKAIQATQLRKGALEALEIQLERTESELRDLSSKNSLMVTEMNKHRQMKEVFSRDRRFYFGESYAVTDRAQVASLETALCLIVGVIPQSQVYMLEKLTYKMTRGNSYIRTDAISDPFYDEASSAYVTKSVFAIFFAARSFVPKMTKVCESLGASIYPYAELDADQVLPEVQAQCDEISLAIEKTQAARHDILVGISADIAGWASFVRAEKGVFDALNRIEMNGMIAVADTWVPEHAVKLVEKTLQQADMHTNAQISSVLTPIADQPVRSTDKSSTPPTHYRTNKFTQVFQDIVESYGVARYGEVNPAVFSAMTFPYLFGIMYGDVGHGAIMTVAAVAMIALETKLAGSNNEIFTTIFQGRYLILLMGLFSTYIGLLYNDMFGISTDFFPSGYVWGSMKAAAGKEMTPLSPSGVGAGLNTAPQNVTPFGIDAAWAETENKLEFYNSIKMKCAIVIGIVQMIAGIGLSLVNHIHFNDWRRVCFQFVPELVFLLCTFGYMALLIVVKWCTPFEFTNDAPSLLETMTNFFLAPGTVTQPLYRGQAYVQVVLLLVAFAMIPLLLIPIPYLAWRDKKRKARLAFHQSQLKQLPIIERGLYSQCASHRDVYDSETGSTGSAHDGRHQQIDDGSDIDLSDITIHQIIHTIEFVLGAVSNTASYLRLWALSLAHAQLSDVFWNFALMAAMSADRGSSIVIFIGVAIWLLATIFVLLLMESLSAFLHTLRLHWVEFQNKFYYGDGVKFQPFDLTQCE